MKCYVIILARTELWVLSFHSPCNVRGLFHLEDPPGFTGNPSGSIWELLLYRDMFGGTYPVFSFRHKAWTQGLENGMNYFFTTSPCGILFAYVILKMSVL